MFAMGPKRKPTEVRMFFGDSIFGQGATQFLEHLGLEETSYLAIDEYHLLYQDWPRYFGDAWPKFTKLFQNYIYSETLEECEMDYTNLKDQSRSLLGDYSSCSDKQYTQPLLILLAQAVPTKVLLCSP
jgi:hypothetical protein